MWQRAMNVTGGGGNTVEYYMGPFTAPASGTIHVDVPFDRKLDKFLDRFRRQFTAVYRYLMGKSY